MIGVLHSWAFFLACAAGAGVLYLFDQARKRDRVTSSTRCVCIHPRAMHDHFRPGTDCGKCDCGEFVPAVQRVRSLQPPPRDAVRTYPPFSVSAVDRMVDDTTRGAE